jgi:hypothetical protein
MSVIDSKLEADPTPFTLKKKPYPNTLEPSEEELMAAVGINPDVFLQT